MTLREIVNEELNKLEIEEIKSFVKDGKKDGKSKYIKIKNYGYIDFNKIKEEIKNNENKINKEIILHCLSKTPTYMGQNKTFKLIEDFLNGEQQEEGKLIKAKQNINYSLLIKLTKELIKKRKDDVDKRISKGTPKVLPNENDNKEEEEFKFGEKTYKIKAFRKGQGKPKVTIDDINILTITREGLSAEKRLKQLIENGFYINQGDIGEGKVQLAPQESAQLQDKKTEEQENLEENINPDYFYSLILDKGVTTSYNNEGKNTANSADNVYLFKNKKVLTETKNTFNKVVDDPWGEDDKGPSLQKDLYAIIRFLDPKLNTSIKGEDSYTFGVFVNNFVEKKDTRVFVDNSNNGYTKIKLDTSLKEKLNTNNDFVTFKDYTNLVKGSSIKRILSLKQLDEQVINPSLENIEKVVIIKNIIGKEEWNNLNSKKSVVTEGVFDNIKKGAAAARMALALGTSKLDPNYKSSQNYQQNTKIERQYNQNQEIFKAAKKSLDSIINFCKKYGLNNSLQEANRLLPLLNKKMAASVETKYFNY